ncbi:unannotated protein [freshwater metagenome]|uniref:Unannotated protein n=1 Tax=freshwater metagenome TaxID=449393 RepID=A0A6J7RUI5_9ZZZZ
MADARDHWHAQQRDGAAESFVTEGEEVGQRATAAGDDDRLHLLNSREVCQRLRDCCRGLAVLNGREAPDQSPGPAAALEAGKDVVAGLARFARDHADRARQLWAREQLLRLEQPFCLKLTAQRRELGQQVTLAGNAQIADIE